MDARTVHAPASGRGNQHSREETPVVAVEGGCQDENWGTLTTLMTCRSSGPSLQGMSECETCCTSGIGRRVSPQHHQPQAKQTTGCQGRVDQDKARGGPKEATTQQRRRGETPRPLRNGESPPSAPHTSWMTSRRARPRDWQGGPHVKVRGASTRRVTSTAPAVGQQMMPDDVEAVDRLSRDP